MSAEVAAGTPGTLKARPEARTKGKAGGRALTIIPPEGVPFDLGIASLFARGGAQIIDIIITVLASLLVLLALGLTGSMGF